MNSRSTAAQAIDLRISQGTYLPPANSIPYGYLRNARTNSFEVDPETSRIVLRVFRLRSELYSYTAIANILNNEGIPSPGKIKFLRGQSQNHFYGKSLWTRQAIRSILEDQVYMGNRVHGRKKSQTSHRKADDDAVVISCAHPSIVSKDLFEQIQRINKQEVSQTTNFAPAGTNNKHLFLGRLFCADCGKPLTSFARKSGTRHNNPSSVFYECSDYHNFKRCSTHYVGDDILTEALHEAIIATSNNVLIANRYGRDIGPQKKKLSALEKTSSVLAQKHTQLSLQLRDLYEQVSNGKITRAYRDEASAAVRKERDALEARQKHLESQMNELKQQIQAILFFADAFKAYQRRPVLTQELANVMLDKIEVHADSSIVIRFRLASYQYTYIPSKP